VIPARYKTSFSIINGLAKVKGSNGYWGFIDKKGKEVVPFKYDEIGEMVNDVAVVKLNDKMGFIHSSGKELTSLKYVAPIYLPKLLNGMYLVSDGTNYGYVDFTGKEVITPQFSSARDFKNGVAGVKQNGQWMLINKTGKPVNNARWAQMGSAYSNGLLPVENSSSLMGYADIDGTIIIPYSYKFASSFTGFYAYATTDFSGYTIITGGGKKVGTDTYKEVKLFSNGIAMLKKDGKWAYAIANGQFKTITPYKYDYAYEFDNGLAWVNFNSAEGYYIDAKGTEYVDLEKEKDAKAETEKNKYANRPDDLNAKPSDGSNKLKRDDVYAAYLSEGDDKVNLSDDGKWRYIDAYRLTLKKGDRLQLSASSSDFVVVAFIKSPSGKENLYIGSKGAYISVLKLDTIITEEGDHAFFITSGETEKKGQYSVNKKLASPAAFMLPDNADFCSRLNFVHRHRELSFDFIEGKLVAEEDNEFFDSKTWATSAQIVKGKEGSLQSKAIGRKYSSVIFSSSSLSEVEKKFKEYEKSLKTCLTGYEFKLKEDASASNGQLKVLEASKDYSETNLLIQKEQTGGYSLLIEVK
jgi:hypothetical protein